MRSLGDYLRRRGREGDDASAVAMEAGRPARGRSGGMPHAELSMLAREVDSVAQYVFGLKREIGALRPNELCRDRLPRLHGDLDSIRETTACSVNAIMEAGEAILNSRAETLDAFRAEAEAKILSIFEACAFEDLTGQRVTRLNEAVAELERRLQRFAQAVNAADSDGYDRHAILAEARREALIVEGPQNGSGCNQADIDALFA